jgi:hypothetical protein
MGFVIPHQTNAVNIPHQTNEGLTEVQFVAVVSFITFFNFFRIENP